MLGISPFWHVPNIQAVHPSLAGLLWITLFTAGGGISRTQGAEPRGRSE